MGGGPTILTTEVQVCSTNTFKNIVKLGNLLETYCTMNFIYFFVDVVGISVVCNHLWRNKCIEVEGHIFLQYVDKVHTVYSVESESAIKNGVPI